MLQNRDPIHPFTTASRTMKLRNKYSGKSCQLFYKSNPLKIVAGKGCKMFNERGETYLDCINNVAHGNILLQLNKKFNHNFIKLVGHCHPDVVEKAYKQMSLISTNNRFLHDELIRFASRITHLLPKDLSVTFFVNSGSEANDLALRLANSHTNAKGVVTLNHAYHGHLTSLMEISPYKFTAEKFKSDKVDNVQVLDCPDTYRGPYTFHNYSNRLAAKLYARKAAKVIKELKKSEHGLNVFIAETYQSCGGQVIPPRKYFELIYKLVDEAGGIKIADEVQVGFGRIGTHFTAIENMKVRPDIVTLAKAIGNGHPVGIVITTDEIATSFYKTGVSYFNTYGGNPVSCGILNAVFDVFEKERLQLNALRTGIYIIKRLRKMKHHFNFIGDIRGEGLFVGVELIQDKKNRKPAKGMAIWVVNYMKNYHKTLISVDGPYENVLKFKPPLVFNVDDAKILLKALEETFNELKHPTNSSAIYI
uniref:CSON014491 protein n=1 Tax=Culicoides sonorensis TaxID=179676 RepID=A0A336KSD8_CULSO